MCQLKSIPGVDDLMYEPSDPNMYFACTISVASSPSGASRDSSTTWNMITILSKLVDQESYPNGIAIFILDFPFIVTNENLCWLDWSFNLNTFLLHCVKKDAFDFSLSESNLSRESLSYRTIFSNLISHTEYEYLEVDISTVGLSAGVLPARADLFQNK